MHISTLFFLAGVQVALGLPTYLHTSSSLICRVDVNSDVDKRDASLAERDAAPISDIVRRAFEIELDDRDLEERAGNTTTDAKDKKTKKKGKKGGKKEAKKGNATTPDPNAAAAATAPSATGSI
jgi:hypothetical protein